MIKIHNLSKTYFLGKENNVHALVDVSFEIDTGKMAAIVGPSGSGKSTILNILGGLDRRYQGLVLIEDKDIKKYDANEYRRKYVQTIFQQFYLVPSLSVYENMLLPIKFGGQLKGKKLEERANFILEKVGLADRKNHKPNELSGGQTQRVAIARALITKPKIILADEPTGNLDSKTGEAIMDLLSQINKEENTTVVIITHDTNLIENISTRIHLKDGKVEKIDK